MTVWPGTGGVLLTASRRMLGFVIPCLHTEFASPREDVGESGHHARVIHLTSARTCCLSKSSGAALQAASFHGRSERNFLAADAQ